MVTHPLSPTICFLAMSTLLNDQIEPNWHWLFRNGKLLFFKAVEGIKEKEGCVDFKAAHSEI